MFQTHIHHWLQQFDNDILIEIFRIITQFGGKRIFLILLSALLFLVNLNKGFIILQSVLIAILVTLGLKVAFNMPRPYHVDPGVYLWDQDLQAVTLPYGRSDADGFWSMHKTEPVDFFRKKELHTWGFPSGHTSMAVIIWGCVALLFRKKWVIGLSLLMIFLIPFSRLYLGVHFLGDLIGGYLLGGILLFIFYKSLIQKTSEQHTQSKHFSPIWALGLPVMPLSIWGLAEVQGLTLLGYLLAAYAAHWLAVRKNIWSLTDDWVEKVLRWLIAGALFLGLGLLLGKLEYILPLKTLSYWPFFKSFFHLFSFFFGSLWITSKLIKR